MQSCDDVDSEQQALISVDDVDTTARFIPHPAWSLFGDSLGHSQGE